MNEVVHTSPTIGSNVEEIVVKNTHFLMWDIGGQESLRSSWNTYYSNTEVSNTSWVVGKGGGTVAWSGSRSLPEFGSWCVCSEHRRQQEPPKSEVTLSQRGSAWKVKLGSGSARSFGGVTRVVADVWEGFRNHLKFRLKLFYSGLTASDLIYFIHKSFMWPGIFSKSLTWVWP